MTTKSLDEHFKEIEEGFEAPSSEHAIEEVHVASQEKEDEIVESPEPAEPVEDLVAKEPVVTEEPVVEEYKPDYSYKVKDEIREIDEDFRPLITSKEMEDKVRNLFNRSAGLDEVSNSRDNFKNKYEAVNTEYSEYRNNFDPAIEAYKRGDKLEAAKLVGFEEEEILNMASKILNYQQLDPQEKQRIDNENKLKQDYLSMQTQYHTKEEEMKRVEAENIKVQTDYELNKPEIKEIASFVDSNPENKTPFMNMVLEYGHMNYINGVKLSPAQCVEAIANRFKPFMPKKTQATPHVKKTVIPHVTSSGTPGRRVINSMEDWDKIEQEIGG